MAHRSATRRCGAVAVAVVTTALVAACGSSSSGGSTPNGSGSTASGGSTDPAVAQASAAVAAAENLPAKILVTKPFTPKAGGSIFNVACDQALVGCHVIAQEIHQAATAIGYKYTLCNAGTTPDQASTCFTNAVNAKPSAIVTNAVGESGAGNGYAAARKAHIPIVGIFTGNKPDGSVSRAEVGGDACAEEGKLTADGVISRSGGKADVLFLGETSIGCDVQRQAGFKAEIAKCTGCSYKLLQFDTSTVEQSLPQQLQASLNANPDVNWIVGTYDQAAQIAVTQVQQASKQGSIQVAGMDGDPANVQFILSDQVQKLDAAFGTGEAAWTGVDAAARIYSGLDVATNIPITIFIIDGQNASQLGSAKSYGGPTNFMAQFKALWGK